MPGGWHYKDQSGYRIPHEGELSGPKEVIDAILTYRLQNMRPVGNPEADFHNYVCTTFPTWCVPDAGEMLQAANAALTGPSGQPRIVDIITAWATALYDHVGKLKLVPINEAEKRSEACRGCPHNVQWQGECPPCVTNAQRLLVIIRQGREATPWRKLHACTCWNFDTRTAVHLEKEHFDISKMPALRPSFCWLKKGGCE